MMNNSQLKELKDENVVDTINDIRLYLRNPINTNSVVILVEGYDDIKVYRKFFIEEQSWVTTMGGGKINLKNCLSSITAEKPDRIIGICDADFYHLENFYPDDKNIFFTDFHDIEMTMIHFPDVLSNTFAEYRLQNKLNEIVNNALQEAVNIAYIRWFNERYNYELQFEGLRLGRFVTLVDGKAKIDHIRYLEVLNKRSTKKVKEVKKEDIDIFIDENATEDFFNLCNGHDVTALLALIIGNKTSHETFCAVLSASFHVMYFIKTKLYTDISAWQKEKNFAILKTLQAGTE